jgi:ubiquinone/menaquinone biosynthesis C-methylase UbiE
MNERHLQLCASAEWAETVRNEILPWVVNGRHLGADVLEVGPGPGLTTDALRERVARLTAVELDTRLATELSTRMRGSNVEVVRADATALPFRDRHFSSATCFTMLHHVPTTAEQDELLAELRRVLKPGGLLVGVDSIESAEWRELHEGDTCVPVDPTTLPTRLEQAGFTDIEVERSRPEPARRFRFSGRAPRLAEPERTSVSLPE